MRFDSSSRIVVTGPTGAVGNALIDELVSCGAQVIAVCREGSPRIASLAGKQGVTIVECNLGGYDRLLDEIEGPIDAFYHLAWAGTSGSARQDWEMQAANVSYALQAALVAADLGSEVFVGVGGQAEYGSVEGTMHPDGPCDPETGYGAAKLAARDLTRGFCKHRGIRHEWCRILSLYGPGDRAQSLIMSVVYTLLAGERPACTPCDQLWDYVYGKDAARAMRMVAESGRAGETYLIASGITRPLREFVCAIRDAIDPSAEIGFGERPYYPNQVMRLEADISNLVRDTGFEVGYSFEEGIRETVEWARAHPVDGE